MLVTTVAEPQSRRLSSRAKVLLPVGLLLLVAATVHRLWFAQVQPTVHEFTGATMGTTYSVKVEAARLNDSMSTLIADTIRTRLDEVNRLMSTYDPTSELSLFNKHESTEPFPLSDLTLEVISLAHVISERTGGAFDVTVAPLVNAWGFGPDDPPAAPPSTETVTTLLGRVGYQKLLIDTEARTVSKTNPRTVADLSAIAKGYAVDQVADVLVELGFETFAVEVGGELKARGRKHDGTAWRVAVEKPEPSRRTVLRIVDLVDEAIATSGDYRNFYELNGTRYAHIIDPRTGWPIQYAGSSVSVVHRDAATADAWATALTVLGAGDGFAVAERERVAALFVWQTDGKLETRATSGFRARFGATPPREDAVP